MSISVEYYDAERDTSLHQTILEEIRHLMAKVGYVEMEVTFESLVFRRPDPPPSREEKQVMNHRKWRTSP